MRDPSSDQADEVRELGSWMGEHGLLPTIPPELAADPEQGAQLLRRILAAPAPPRRRVSRLPGLLAAAAVMLIVLVVAGRDLLTSEPSAAAGTPAMLSYTADLDHLDRADPAGPALAAAARTAGRAPTAGRTGTVQHVASFGWLLTVDSTETAVYPTETEQWLAPDGSTRVDQRRSHPLNLDGTISTTGTATGRAAATDTTPAGTTDPGRAAALPRDPAQLAPALIAAFSLPACDQSPAVHAHCVVIAIEDLYAQYVVPNDLAAALWQVLAAEQGPVSLGSTTDRFGAAVTAVALETTPGSTVEILLVSTATGQLTGTETVTLVDPRLGIDRPTVSSFTAIRQSRWVARVGDTGP
jgi:hypothetical protein